MLSTHLKIPEHEVDISLMNHRGNIMAASYRILQRWCMAQESSKEAFDKMYKALMKIDKRSAMALKLANKFMPDRNGIFSFQLMFHK